ncbi:unnamed protein product [Pleuronectes platessa]|uniref:Maspardin n=1 Tax=Pleuronectes platessa TaxID=8262 RepID=A0A9N7YGA1_PLEPL|nr:unnamed protein product [Pleuronectes platessa]
MWTANSFWLMPAFMLKKIVLGNFAKGPVDPKMADAIDFMVDRLESLNQSELASRLTLNCQNSYVEPHKIKEVAVTIIDVFDQSALSLEAKEEMYKLYPNARRAHLKTGGNFPYLCRSAEVNLYIQPACKAGAVAGGPGVSATEIQGWKSDGKATLKQA